MKDKLQAIIEDAQDDNYSDSPRFVDAILKLLAPELDKAQKWDRVKEIAEYSKYSLCPNNCPYDEMCRHFLNFDCDGAKELVDAIEGEMKDV